MRNVLEELVISAHGGAQDNYEQEILASLQESSSVLIE